MRRRPAKRRSTGPKADFIVRDCIGRQWQLGTVQLDYVLPERFGLEYIGPDNQPHRPVMIHRAPLGSMERFMGILIEHFAGAFPLWLAPEQVRVLPISDKVAGLCAAGARRLLEHGFRASIDLRREDRCQDPRCAAREDSRRCSSSASRRRRARRFRIAIVRAVTGCHAPGSGNRPAASERAARQLPKSHDPPAGSRRE